MLLPRSALPLDAGDRSRSAWRRLESPAHRRLRAGTCIAHARLGARRRLFVEKEARTAAAFAAALAQGDDVPANLVTGKLNNGKKEVPGALLNPTPVTVDQIKPVLIDSGYLDAAELCTGDLQKRCADAGIR